MTFVSLNPQKREDFVENVETRVNRINRAIDQIGELSRPDKYQYTMTDIRKVKACIIERLDQMEAQFAHSKKSDFTLGE
tara:strand:+ start:451 stop:687 length:237 start_codon:yes stop_codon:yes gene_type:complete